MKLRAIFIVKKEKTMKELPKTYEPRDVEDRLYKFWVDNGYFHAERDPDKKPFTIVMPPPNVTGQLHMGHAMDAAMQDVLIRFKRMQGYSALWIPGVDHAGIATQIRVEEELRKEGKTRYDLGREEFLKQTDLIADLFPSEEKGDSVRCGSFSLPVEEQKEPSAHLVTFRMEHVSIKYGSRTILKELDWEVKNGEKWALFGPNGAGKSTLLSLIYADNPQSYANTLYLFDRKRGSGESIWDIKKRIGYVSPEMHLFYMENVPTLNIVGSGFFDSIGLYRKCTEQQQKVALDWMHVFGIEELKDRSFLTLSSGEQRLALLARAFVKDPDLIILDEPLHGLDVSNKKKAAAIIEQFCARPGKTLIYVTHYPHELPASVDKHFRLVKHA